jgi:hypothetical protein
MKMICPKAKQCKDPFGCAHYNLHDWCDDCEESDNTACPACIEVQEEIQHNNTDLMEDIWI